MTNTAPTEQQIKIAAKIYETRDLMRQLLGDKYAAEVVAVAEIINMVATARGTTTISAAIQIAQENGGMGTKLQMLLFAAVVELTEPSPGILIPGVASHIGRSMG
jgi:hypothetical protein